ncbi:MAG: methyltransferase domain-containing protein [Betaproteobacteria bacterium]|nr:methyltransferase domain-containing protein [Betaproteobacteria bacterium]
MNFSIHWRYDSMTDRYSSFAEWFASTDGEYLRSREQIILDAMTADLFGFNAVQVGLRNVDLLRASRIKHRYRLDVAVGADLLADPARLPFAGQSIDLLVLPHALEFFPYPHQILREAERVLIPEGNLLISGFNPWSLWGVYYRYKRARGNFVWEDRFVSLHRLRDWLSLIGCEQQDCRSCCFVPPLAQTGWVRWFEWLETAGEHWWAKGGGVYFVHAVKRVHGMRLILPDWQDRRDLGRLLRPASRALQSGSRDE